MMIATPALSSLPRRVVPSEVRPVTLTAVPVPPEIYQYLEKFVVSHFVPQERKKRKRKNWSETPG